jgi:hypothetical protein
VFARTAALADDSKIAQRFIAGNETLHPIKSVERTTEAVDYPAFSSAVRFADFILFAPVPQQ